MPNPGGCHCAKRHTQQLQATRALRVAQVGRAHEWGRTFSRSAQCPSSPARRRGARRPRGAAKQPPRTAARGWPRAPSGTRDEKAWLLEFIVYYFFVRKIEFAFPKIVQRIGKRARAPPCCARCTPRAALTRRSSHAAAPLPCAQHHSACAGPRRRAAHRVPILKN